MALLAEMGWGGLVQYPATITWTDISEYVDVAQGVTITRGAADELSETQPGTATLTLDNSDGRFTPNNPSSPYYPFVRRNAPIRISVALVPTRSGSAPYPLSQLGDDFDDNRVNTTLWPNNYGGATEAGGRMRLPTTPGVASGYQTAREWTMTGNKLTAKLVTLPAVGGSSSASTALWVNSTVAGTRVGWRYDAVAGTVSAQAQVGSTDGSAVTLTYSAIDHVWLRVRESGGTLYWESSGDGWDWDIRRTKSTSSLSWDISQPVAVEFTATRTGGSADVTEWDLVGATVYTRFCGVVNEFPVDWEGLTSSVQISCTDMFKRLNKLPALRSMAAQEILLQAPMVYFPLTEDSSATSAGDVSGNAAPSLAITQAGSGGTLAMGAVTGPAETGESAPAFTPSSATAGKWLSVDLGSQFQDLTAQFQCYEAWFQTTTTGRAIFGVHSPDLLKQHVVSVAAGGGLQIEWTMDGTALTVEPVSGPTTMADGNWHHVVYDQRAGSVWVDGTLVDSALAVPRDRYERIVHVGGYRNAKLWSGSVMHFAIYNTIDYSVGPLITGHYAAGMTGFSGETADARIARLASYASISSVAVVGSIHDPIASQGPGGSTPTARMREVEATESARLFANREQFGLVYQSRGLRYNPLPGAEAFQIAYADLETKRVELADDDQKLVNDVTGSRPGGATQRVTAPSSVLAFGPYPQELSILKTSDNSVLDASYWLVSRYADPAPELREVPVEAFTMDSYQAVLAADISGYFSVTSMPAQAPASSMRVTVEGYTETIKEQSHLIQFHTSTTANDTVWVLDDSRYSVLDSTTRLAY